MHKAHRNVDCSRFSGSIRAKEAENFSALDGKRKIVQGMHAGFAQPRPVLLRNALIFQREVPEFRFYFPVSAVKINSRCLLTSAPGLGMITT